MKIQCEGVAGAGGLEGLGGTGGLEGVADSGVADLWHFRAWFLDAIASLDLMMSVSKSVILF